VVKKDEKKIEEINEEEADMASMDLFNVAMVHKLNYLEAHRQVGKHNVKIVIEENDNEV